MNTQLTAPAAGTLTTVDLVADWLEYIVKDNEASPNTVTAYRRSLSKFVTWLGPDATYTDVLPAVVVDYKAEMREQFSAQTVNLYLVAIRSFYSYLVSRNLMPFNPAREIKGPKRQSTGHKRDALTASEVVELLVQPDTSTPAGSRDMCILTLMLYTACRSVEIHRANVGDLRARGDRLVLFVRGKGRRAADELVVIPHEQEPTIRDYAARFRSGAKPDEPLFISFSRRTAGSRLSLSAIREIVMGYFKAANVSGPGKTTHSLRHTAITSAITNGGTPMQVQAMARHKSYDTTLGYFHEVSRTGETRRRYDTVLTPPATPRWWQFWK